MRLKRDGVRGILISLPEFMDFRLFGLDHFSGKQHS